MKASKRKTGGAYRRYKQFINRHAKEGKDRTKAKQQVAARKATYNGFTAVQSAVNNHIAVYNKEGGLIFRVATDKPLTGKELHTHLKHYVETFNPLFGGLLRK